MARSTGSYREIEVGGEAVRAFLPAPLPPTDPPLRVEGRLAELHGAALSALGRLAVAAALVPSAEWFIYGFVRKEAVVSSQIEGTQASLMDVVTYEVTHQAARPADAAEVCNYVDALAFARAEMGCAGGQRIGVDLLCAAHALLMRGERGAHLGAGTLRTRQNWVGGATPALATFVPPPPDAVPGALTGLVDWLDGDDPLPPLVRAGLAHVQFESIHPFLDGNGRIGRLLVSLLVERWELLDSPLLYMSLAFKRHRQEYYDRLGRVRTEGDWEGWTGFFLDCVREAAENGVDAAQRLFALLGRDRRRVAGHRHATVTAIRLYDLLPDHPIVTLSMATDLLSMTKPTAGKAIDVLAEAGVLQEITGRQRDRAYAYSDYLAVLGEDTELPGR